ncbi:MAG: AraC family transcriptional regulator ligand-binding domain-containing protein [Comamonadaceae bacterium]|nr:AraC family transcriptional regulator ligand-binding domain-containing protein [Comamonadaceae bacterium]
MAVAPKRVPVRYLLLLSEVLRASGVEMARVLERAGIDTGRLDKRDNQMTAPEVDAFILAATQLTGRDDLGFELGRRVKMNSHDLLGYGLLSCPDMDAFLRMTCRHYHLMVETWAVRTPAARSGPRWCTRRWWRSRHGACVSFWRRWRWRTRTRCS